jgi:hypothetical protein
VIFLVALSVVFVAALLAQQWLIAQEREEWTAERQKLLDRIQAPERVVIGEFEPSSLTQYVAPDDDAAFWEAKREMSDG